MIRSISPSDNDAIVSLSIRSGLFSVEESSGIHEMLDEYHGMDAENGHKILIWEESERLVGIVYFSPRPFADRVWELLMIAVDESHHREGYGSKLLNES